MCYDPTPTATSCPCSADNSRDIKDAVARILRESGSTTLIYQDVYDYVEQYTNMPCDLLPYEPFKPYKLAVKEALDDNFRGK
jgi:hypothetical protein